MAIFSLFARGRALSSGSQPPASPVSSTASSAVTARDDDDVFSVDSDFLSDDDRVDAGYVSADDGIAAPPATSDWLSVLDGAQPAADAHTARDDAGHAPDDEAQAVLDHDDAVRDADDAGAAPPAADDAGAAPPAAAMPMLPGDWSSEPYGSRSAVAADESDTSAAAAS
ncbi:hypothetical protein PRIC1_004540 [Phytophthora ramorum]